MLRMQLESVIIAYTSPFPQKIAAYSEYHYCTNLLSPSKLIFRYTSKFSNFRQCKLCQKLLSRFNGVNMNSLELTATLGRRGYSYYNVSMLYLY